jgi:hypothetical protein
MPALLEVQRSVRAMLLDRAAPNAALDGVADELLAIYRNTAFGTLVNALRLSFPAVQRLVGTEFFEGCAREFIRGHLPVSAYLNDYGQEFPPFLAQFAPAAGIAYLSDVAQLEWAINRALHALDAAPLDVTRLSGLGEAALPSVRFRVHPAVSVLQLPSPADSIWRAVLEGDDAAMAAIDLNSAPAYLLIERNDDGLHVRRLSASAWQFTASLIAGSRLFEAVAAVASRDAAQIDSWLAEHLKAGRFIDFQND